LIDLLETLEKISRIVISTIGVWGPGLLIVLIYVIPRFWPKMDSYFQTAYLTLMEVDDITDAILEEFPNLSYVDTVDDVIAKVISILEKRYNLEGQTKEQIKERIQANIERKKGWSINWEDGVGKIEFEKDF
jgi:hypothetical protein